MYIYIVYIYIYIYIYIQICHWFRIYFFLLIFFCLRKHLKEATGNFFCRESLLYSQEKTFKGVFFLSALVFL